MHEIRLEDLKPNMKVRIVAERSETFNPAGLMDKYLNSVMTIKELDGVQIFMYEDENERGGYGWYWYLHDIAEIIST